MDSIRHTSAAVASIALLASAGANAVPPAQAAKFISASASNGTSRRTSRGPTAFAPLTLRYGGSYGRVSSTDGFADTSQGPSPSVQAFSSFTGGPFGPHYPSQSISSFVYSFLLTGPDRLDVPVIISGRTRLSRIGFGNAAAILRLNDSDGIQLRETQFRCDGIDTTDCGSRSFTEVFAFRSFLTDSGAVSGTIDIQANVSSNTGFGYNSGSAFMDPFLAIDPEFLLRNPGYSLAVSPGVGNGPATTIPEPAAWLLMIAGLGAVGARLRAQRRSTYSFCSIA